MSKFKKIVLSCVLIAFLVTPAFAFLYEVKILKKEEIKKLTDDQLMQEYTDALIEKKTSEIFQGKAGFTPKEYGQFKELLGLIIRLREEMIARQMEPPPIEEWIR